MIKKSAELIRTTFFVLLATGALAACGNLPGEIDVTDGYGGVLLQVQATAPDSAARAAGEAESLVLPITDSAGSDAGSLTITDARLVLSDIELEQEESEIDSPAEEEQEIEIEFVGPFLVDFLAGTVVPEIPYTELLPGTYTQIKLSLYKVEDDDLTAGELPVDAEDPLFGNSVYIAGTYTGPIGDGGDTATDISFELFLNIDEDLESEISGLSEAVIIDEGIVNTVLVALRTNKWLIFDNLETNSDGIDFSDMTTVMDGETEKIVLDGTELGDNGAILNVILENIKISIDYGEDEDDDGYLDPEEDDDPDSEDDDDS